MYKMIKIKCIDGTEYKYDSRTVDSCEVCSDHITIRHRNGNEDEYLVFNMRNVIAYDFIEVNDVKIL